MSTAQAQKSRVEDISGRTEFSTRYANPDGSWTVEAAAGQVRTRTRTGGWAGVDPSVVPSVDGYKQHHGGHNVRFSPGGDRSIGQIETESGKTITLTSDANLPTPTPSGRELTYADAADGDDMVMRSFAEGFNFSVVIGQRPQITESPGGSQVDESNGSTDPAAPSSNSSPATASSAAQSAWTEATPAPDISATPIPQPIEEPSGEPTPTADESPTPAPTQTASPKAPPAPTPTPTESTSAEPAPTATSLAGPEYSFGLSMGGLTATVSDEGTVLFKDGTKVVAAVSEPVMWDSAAKRHIGKVALKLNQGKLVLTPDPEFLAHPDTAYPVTVDPSVVLNVASDTWVQQLLNTSSQVDSPELNVGQQNLGLNPRRSYLNFDLSALPTDIAVSEAKVNLSNFSTGSCTGSAITMTRITGAWSPGSLTWSTQPAVTTSGQSSSTASYGASGCATETPVSFDATQMVTDWVSGAANLGVRLKADTESQASGTRKYRSMENGDPAKIPTLSVTYNTRPSVPANSAVEPSISDGSVFLTAAKRPTFSAAVADPDGSLVTAEFKLTQGASTVDSVTLPAVPSGTRVSRKPPSDLGEGTYQARWRASDSALMSAWSAPLDVVVDQTAPSSPSIDCTGTTADAWYATRPAATTTCTITSGSGTDSIAAELNGAEVTFPALSSGSTSATFDLPTDGMFDLHVTAYDKAGNTSEKSHTFGIGNGALTSPTAGARSVNRFGLNASSKSGASDAVLQWRRVGDSSWSTASHVTQDGSTWSGATTTQGSMSRTGTLSWSAGEETGAATPSLIEARVCFNYPSDPQRCTTVTSLVLVPHAFGGAFPTSAVGPASVALQTGEFQLGAADVNDGGLSLGRTYESFDGPTSAAESVFGPGWVADLDGPPTGLGGATVVDRTAADGTITLMAEGESTVYRHESGTVSAQTTGVYKAQGEGATLNERLELVAGTPKTLVLTEEDGTQTTWTHISGTTWTITKVDDSTADPETTYAHDSDGLVIGIYDGPTGVTCNATTQDRGCNALLLSYVTISGSKRLDKVELRTWDPNPGSDGSPGAGAMSTTTVARYSYDSAGKLSAFWDPRETTSSGPLETSYTYQTAGGSTYLASITPPGEKTWNFTLNSSGQLSSVTRPLDGGVTGFNATWQVAYDVPLSGSNLPDMTASGVAKWKQPTAPASATAVFGPDTTDSSDYRFADITYFTRSGLATNTASFGAGDWQIGSTGYDDRNNVTWELSALDRDKGLKANMSAASIASVMSTLTKYNTDGTRVEATYSPIQYVVIDSTAASVRAATENVYDDEAAAESVPVPDRPTPDPDMPALNMVVETRESALIGTSRFDMQKTRYRYDKVVSTDGDGWTLGTPTRTSQQLGTGWSTAITRYDTSGNLVETRSPQGVAANDGAGSDSRSILTRYFTSDSSSPLSACRNHPEWVTQVCQSAPAGGSAAVETTTGLDYLGNPTRVIDSAGSMSRTVITTRDSAGRATKTSLSVSGASSGDQPLGDTTYEYSLSTGALTTTTRGAATVATVYDTWGRVTSQTDGSGNTTTTTYDGAGRVHTVEDGKGTATYTWDGTDAHGEIEHRGLLTKLDAGLPSGPDEFSSAYDAGGNEVERQLPGGVIANWIYDNVGRASSAKYSRNGGALIGHTVYFDAHSRAHLAMSGLTQRRYDYDGRNRLTKVEDKTWPAGANCVTRSYTFSLDSDRTSLATSGPAGDGSCTTASPTTVTSTFDGEDRITNTGYTYDDLGRTRTVPAVDTTNVAGGTTTVAYHANDMVAAITQGTAGTTYTLDPTDRVSVTSHTTAGVSLRETTDHYAGTSDSPTWTSIKTRPDGSSAWATKWTRWIHGPDGGLGIQYDADGTATLELTDLHGDVVSQLPISSTAGLTNYQEFTEYGLAHSGQTPTNSPYGYLGSHQRSNDTDPGLTLMGARLYSPVTGRFLSVDSIRGGNDNAYTYAVDPINQADLTGTKNYYFYNEAWGVEFKLSDSRLSKIGTDHNVWYYAIKRTARYGYYAGRSTRYGIDRRRFRYKYYEYRLRKDGTPYRTGNFCGIELIIERGGDTDVPWIVTAYPINVNNHSPATRNEKSWAPNWVRDSTPAGPRNYDKVSDRR